jgi:hypothetical protein
MEDFTEKDKVNLLDLFVNNEKTLLKIYEALFPHRASHITTHAGKTNAQLNPIKDQKNKNFSMYTNNPPVQAIDFEDSILSQFPPNSGDPLSVSLDLIMATKGNNNSVALNDQSAISDLGNGG